MPPKASHPRPTPAHAAAFRNLHAAFTDLIALSPWTIVHESVILGVRHPRNGEMYYAYFMGSAGEVIGFNLYRGSQVAHWRHAYEEIMMGLSSESELLSHTYYQLSAAKKTGLHKEITELHAIAGVTVPRGKQGYLEPLSYRGGYAPDLMDEGAVLEVLPLLSGFGYLLENLRNGRLSVPEALDDEDDQRLVAEWGSGGEWSATTADLPEPAPVDLFPFTEPEVRAWTGLRLLPKTKSPFILHGWLLPTPFLNDEGVAMYPLMLFCLDPASGIVLGMNMLNVETWKAGAVPALLQILKDLKQIPPAFEVADERLLPMAESCGRLLDIPARVGEHAAELVDDFTSMLGGQLGV